MPLGVVDEHLDRVEAHRLRVDQPDRELCRVGELQEGRLVGRAREGRRVALVEAEAGEAGDLVVELLGVLLGQAVAGHAALDEAAVELLHLSLGAPGAHGTPEAVRLGRAETRDFDGDAHDLLLVEDHAQRLGQDRLQAGMEVGHRLEALAPSQVGVDGVALDGAGPDDGDLDDQVVERLRAALGQRLHLRPRLDLEDAHRVRRLDHGEDLGDVLRQAVEIDAHAAVGLDVARRRRWPRACAGRAGRA
jgi:hypothetical protein